MKFIWTLVLVGVLVGIVCAEDHKPWPHGSQHEEHHHDGDQNHGHHGHGSYSHHGEHDGNHHDNDEDHKHRPGNPWRHHHPSDSDSHDLCHYRSTDGTDYDLRLMDKHTKMFNILDVHTKTTFYINPCGSVPISGCDPDAAVCAIDKEGKPMTIGLNKFIRWADGARGANIEVVYGGGEKTDDGIPRKAVIEYRCSLPDMPKPMELEPANPHKPDEISPKPDEISPAHTTHGQGDSEEHKVTTEDASQRIISIGWDGATLKLVMLSPYACPVSQYCAMTVTQASCENSQGTCEWTQEGYCEAAPRPCFVRSGAAAVVMLLLMAIGVMGLIATCLCCCSCCMLARRKRNRSSSLPMTHKKKHVKKTSKRPRGVKKTNKPAPIPSTPSAPVYQPQQQLNPLTYVPMHMYPQFNPYTVGQAVPMVPVSTPQGE